MPPKSVWSIAAVGMALTTLAACGTVVREARYRATGLTSPGPSDAARAATAWHYFRTQRNRQNGIVVTAEGAGFTTPGTIGDDLAASYSALRLSVIERAEYRSHVDADLAFLNHLPLTATGLPGRVYDVRSGGLTDFPAARDPGWSATSIGRLLIWLRILRADEPSRAAAIDAIVARWQLCRAMDAKGVLLTGLPDEHGGYLIGPDVADGRADYAEQGLTAWGVRGPAGPEPDFAVDVEGVSLPLSGSLVDSPLLTTPYALIGIEFGWSSPDGVALPRDKAIFNGLLEAQRRRTATTRFATARDDYRQESAPFEVVSAVLARGVPWVTSSIAGVPHPQLAITSVKASYAMWALDKTPFTTRLIAEADRLNDHTAGWREGHIESTDRVVATRTSATNAIVLEALLFRRAAPFFRRMHDVPDDRCPAQRAATTSR